MEFREILLKYDFDRKKVEKFLELHNLFLDKDVEYTIVLEEKNSIEDKIIATGSIAGNVLKCMAVDEEYQGLGLSNKVITKLIEEQAIRGRNHLFIFTKPMYKEQMKEFGFSEVVSIEDKVSLLDNDISNLKKMIDKLRIKIETKVKNLTLNNKKINISSIVMNANPFTKGHKYLAEYAASKSDIVLVFVVKENKSKFSFDVRMECVKQGLKDIDNIIVCDGGDYIISNATFPSYFLKEENIINDSYAKLDATIFAKYIAKELKIQKRFLGEEPLDKATKNYNDNIREIFSKYSIDVEIIPRKKIGDNIISASNFRKLLSEKKLDKLENVVPQTTLEVLEKYNLLGE